MRHPTIQCDYDCLMGSKCAVSPSRRFRAYPYLHISETGLPNASPELPEAGSARQKTSIRCPSEQARDLYRYHSHFRHAEETARLSAAATSQTSPAKLLFNENPISIKLPQQQAQPTSLNSYKSKIQILKRSRQAQVFLHCHPPRLLTIAANSPFPAPNAMPIFNFTVRRW